jgi:hypothetical protein
MEGERAVGGKVWWSWKREGVFGDRRREKEGAYDDSYMAQSLTYTIVRE